MLSANNGPGRRTYFRFQRTPSFESSIRMPFSASSLRICVGAREVAMLLGLGALGNQRVDIFVGEALRASSCGGTSLARLPSASAQSRRVACDSASRSSRTSKTCVEVA